MARKTMMILLPIALAALGGCQAFAFLGYLIAPREDDTKTVQAEYKESELANRSLAVVVYVDEKIRFEYPTAQELVTLVIAAEFEKEDVRDRIKNLRVLRPKNVLDYQERNIHWDEMGKAELGKALGADFVLFVSLEEFTTREPMSINMLRGIVSGEVSLYKTSLPERESRVYKGPDIRVVHPKEALGGVPGYDDRKIREETVAEFAKLVVWKFYKHKELVEP